MPAHKPHDYNAMLMEVIDIYRQIDICMIDKFTIDRYKYMYD